MVVGGNGLASPPVVIVISVNFQGKISLLYVASFEEKSLSIQRLKNTCETMVREHSRLGVKDLLALMQQRD